MTEVPPFLFLVTSTALVLGGAITVRGLYGFRQLPVTDAAPVGISTDIAPAMAPVDTATTTVHQGTSSGVDVALSSPGVTTSADVEATATAAAAVGSEVVHQPVRDMREPIVMVIAGLLICTFTLLAIGALVNSA